MRETFVTSAFRHLEKERKKFPEEKMFFFLSEKTYIVKGAKLLID